MSSADAPPTRQLLYAGRIVNLGLETGRLPDGREVQLEIIRHQGAAGVVPVHEDGTVTLIRQHRHAAGGLIIEIPAGVLEPGEAPVVSAARELAEEVRLQATEWLDLGTILSTPGFTDERIHLFLARGLSLADGELDGDEWIEPLRLPLTEAVEMATDGRIQDAKSICALLRAARVLKI